ncbi:MAG TPA: lytic transglycosylase domain-containing protein [Thermoanaerobaculia bacterium]|nr:lytic transglycosylase domain-containing protein [Thermoanaerobaculia bacterium]
MERERRAFKHRLVGGDERSLVRREVLKTKAKRFHHLRRRYATLMLGAAIVVGGVGVPVKVHQMLHADQPRQADRAGEIGFAERGDIAFPEGELEQTEDAKEQLSLLSEQVREEFFKAEIPFGSLIYREALKNDLAPELVAAVVKQESQFKPNARSHRGAQGLMQLVPRTGRWMGAKDLMNPAQNIRAGAKYLKYLNERFDGDQQKVLAAYNAGEGNVRKFGGIPPFRETQNYVAKVLDLERDFQDQVTGKVAETIETGG